jgi:hypothetical protein
MPSSELLLMQAPQQNFSLCQDFALRDFLNLDARFSILQLANICSIDHANVTMIQDEGVYSRFSLLRSKLSNMHLNLPTHINYVLMPSPTTDESGSLKICLQYLSVLPLNYYISFSKIFQKNVSWCFPAVFRPYTCLLLATFAMILHHTPSLENFHGLLSMSSRMVCP